MDRFVATLKKLMWGGGICAWLWGVAMFILAPTWDPTDHDGVAIAQAGGIASFVVGALIFWFLAALYTYKPQNP